MPLLMYRLRHVTSLALLSAAACAGPQDGRVGLAAEHDSARRLARSPVTATAPEDVRAACDSVSLRWSPDAGSHVGRSAVHNPRNPYPPAGVPVCGVNVFVADLSVAAHGPRNSFWADTASHHWAAILADDADGPSGFSRVLHRGSVRCSVTVEFDAEDDADSTYVPKPWYREDTECWSAHFVPSDTARSP
jgi:hypothetical protein